MSTVVMKEAFGNAGVLKTKAKQVSPAPNDVRIPTIRSIKETTAVAERRQYIGDIPVHMAGLVARIRGIQSASPEEQTIRSGELKALEDEVLVHLDSGEKLLADAARQAYAMAMVETLPADKRLVVKTIEGNENARLPGLLELKILELGDDKNAITVMVYRNVYIVNGNREFAIRLAKGLAEGAAHAAKTAHELYHSETEGLKAQVTISVAELLAEKPGRPFLTVSDVRNGDRFLPGGALLAESDGRVVKVSRAIGHFRRIMTEIAEAQVFISVESLSRERFESGGGLSDERFRLCQILHTVLRRGIAEAQAGAQKETV